MKKIAWLFLIFLPFGIGYLYWLNDQNWRDVIPIDFELGSTVYSNSDQQGLRESCGVHIFELEQSSIDKIGREGLKFFNSARQARGYDEYYYSYGEWLPTPRKDWKRSENWSYELMCSNLGSSLVKIIVKSARSKGAYYSYGQEKVLMVIPEHGLIILTHNG